MEIHIHVIGDSHCFEFNGAPNAINHHLGPRTMHRIGRDGLSILDFRTFSIKENDIVVLIFGELDVRFQIGKQIDKKNRDLNEIIDTLLSNYFQTIIINKSFYQNLTVIVNTVTPPTDRNTDVNLVPYGTLMNRHCITRKLNKKLIEMASKHAIDVIDAFDDFVNIDGELPLDLSDGGVHISPYCNKPILDQLNKILISKSYSIIETRQYMNVNPQK